MVGAEKRWIVCPAAHALLLEVNIILGTVTAVPIFNNLLNTSNYLPLLIYQRRYNLAATIHATVQTDVVGTLHATTFGARYQVKGFQRVM